VVPRRRLDDARDGAAALAAVSPPQIDPILCDHCAATATLFVPHERATRRFACSEHAELARASAGATQAVLPGRTRFLELNYDQMLTRWNQHRAVFLPGFSDQFLDARAEATAFKLHLREVTPRVWLVPTIIAVDVALYMLMVYGRGDRNLPFEGSLIWWGGNFGPKTLGGQPWRLLTYAFLHAGRVHLIANMVALVSVGVAVERIYGQLRLAVICLCAAVCGGLASALVHPQLVSVGASGVVFGVYGALLVFLLRRRKAVSILVLSTPSWVIGCLMAYNVWNGATDPSVDFAAHVGGLLGGLVAGAWLVQPLDAPRAPGGRRPGIAVAALAALSVVTVIVLPRPPDLLATILEFGEVESRVVDEYNTLADQSGQGALTAADFAAKIDAAIVPPWHEARLRLIVPKRWTESERKRVDRMAEYAEAREQQWIWTSTLLRTNDPRADDKRKTYRDLAAKILQDIRAD
jgi:rhomboid protease GluP